MPAYICMCTDVLLGIGKQLYVRYVRAKKKKIKCRKINEEKRERQWEVEQGQMENKSCV